jgi:hypothetical protein
MLLQRLWWIAAVARRHWCSSLGKRELLRYSGAKVDQGFETPAGFVDLNTRARKDGHATLNHDIHASPRCRCPPGASRGERRGRRRRRDGQAGCIARPAEPARQAPHRDRRHLCAGGQATRHHHTGSVWAYVLSGAVRSQNSATGPAKMYRAGDSFFEPPGSEHLVSENASATESASLLAVNIADDGAGLTTVDK